MHGQETMLQSNGIKLKDLWFWHGYDPEVTYIEDQYNLYNSCINSYEQARLKRSELCILQ